MDRQEPGKVRSFGAAVRRGATGMLVSREAGILAALLLLGTLLALLQPTFITPRNLYLVSRQIAYVAIPALGVLFVILTGGIDLSVGSIIGISGVACGFAFAAAWPAPLAVAAGIAAGAGVGAINGLVVAGIGVTPFIVTLGMLGMARGAILVLTRGDSIRSIPEPFLAWGMSDVGCVPMAVLILILAAAAAHVTLQHTVFGRRLYAVGGNEEASGLSGIRVRWVKFCAYAVCGGLSSLTGVLFVARFRSAQANAGFGMELDAIAAAVIGGTSLMGGQGTVAGVLIGATIMGVIRNGLVLLRVSSYWQELIIGLIIVLAAAIDRLRVTGKVRS